MARKLSMTLRACIKIPLIRSKVLSKSNTEEAIEVYKVKVSFSFAVYFRPLKGVIKTSSQDLSPTQIEWDIPEIYIEGGDYKFRYIKI